jgi:hypothetical protein
MCRKYNHDYFARKHFLGHIMHKSKEIQEQIVENAKINAIEYQVSLISKSLEIQRRNGKSRILDDHSKSAPSHFY